MTKTVGESKNAESDDPLNSLSLGTATRYITRTVPRRKVGNLGSQGPFAPLERWRSLLIVSRYGQNYLMSQLHSLDDRQQQRMKHSVYAMEHGHKALPNTNSSIPPHIDDLKQSIPICLNRHTRHKLCPLRCPSTVRQKAEQLLYTRGTLSFDCPVVIHSLFRTALTTI